MPTIATVTLNPALDRLLEIQRLSADDANRVVREETYAAGKGIDASRVIHELGGATLAYALVGGMNGQEIADRLAARGVPTNLVKVDGDTRTNILLFERASGRQFMINAAGPRVAPEDFEALLIKLERQRGRFQAVIVSGSIPLGLPPDSYAALVRRIDDCRVFVDADGDALGHAVAERPWGIKPNRHEAARLLNETVETDEDALRAVRKLMGLGIEHVLLSMGKKGALLGHQGKLWRGSSPEVKAISAVGSGDTMTAVYTLRICEGEAPAEALRWALAGGAATAMTPGTELCHRADVESLVRETNVTPLGA
jgi:6-phosphofructokinase 2